VIQARLISIVIKIFEKDQGMRGVMVYSTLGNTLRYNNTLFNQNFFNSHSSVTTESDCRLIVQMAAGKIKGRNMGLPEELS